MCHEQWALTVIKRLRFFVLICPNVHLQLQNTLDSLLMKIRTTLLYRKSVLLYQKNSRDVSTRTPSLYHRYTNSLLMYSSILHSISFSDRLSNAKHSSRCRIFVASKSKTAVEEISNKILCDRLNTELRTMQIIIDVSVFRPEVD